MKTEAQNHLLVSNSFLHSNRRDLEDIRSKVKLEEEVTDQVQDKKKHVSREFSQVTQAIRNLFSRCQASVRNRAVFAANKESSSIHEVLSFSLDLIHARVVDLIEISSEYRDLDLSTSSYGGDFRENSVSTNIASANSKSYFLKPSSALH